MHLIPFFLPWISFYSYFCGVVGNTWCNKIQTLRNCACGECELKESKRIIYHSQNKETHSAPTWSQLSLALLSLVHVISLQKWQVWEIARQCTPATLPYYLAGLLRYWGEFRTVHHVAFEIGETYRASPPWPRWIGRVILKFTHMYAHAQERLPFAFR